MSLLISSLRILLPPFLMPTYQHAAAVPLDESLTHNSKRAAMSSTDTSAATTPMKQNVSEVRNDSGHLPRAEAPREATTAVPSRDATDRQGEKEEEEEGIYMSSWTRWTTRFSILILVSLSLLWEILGYFIDIGVRIRRPGYAPLLNDFVDYWNRRFYRRTRDCFDRPIDSRPSRVIGIMERTSDNYNLTFQLTGRIIPSVNLGSYNYLGFADDTPSITHDVLDTIDDFGVGTCSAVREAGNSIVIQELEQLVAHYVGKEDAIVCAMGFGTNFKGLPALFGKGTLCISDHLNHSSIINGVRSSGATVHPFRHGNYAMLERVVREAVILGQDPKNNVTSYKPWDRIVILAEGIYSMEGEIIDLPRVVEIKKKYKALLFVDEAHSIGAIGRTGRGVCEHCGVDPKDVDVLMGTFTKSFGSIGGYIAADKKLIDYVRINSALSLHCDSLPAACAQQIISVLNVLLGKDGTDLGEKRIAQLKENSTFFRQGLLKLGFQVLGDDASPVIPMMSINLGKIITISRLCLERGVAIVVAAYPVVSFMESRIRFCVSAAHTREDLQYALDVLEEIGKGVYLNYAHSTFFGAPSQLAINARRKASAENQSST